MDWHKGIAIAKDPDAVIDHAWDFGGHKDPWLEEGDSLVDHTVTATNGINIDSSQISGDQVIVWLSGGTAGLVYYVSVHVETAQGRQTDRTVEFWVAQQ